MAKLEIVVLEAPSAARGGPEEHPSYGLLLADVLKEASGEHLWPYRAPRRMRERWLHAARTLGDENLERIALSETVPVSLQHLAGRDPDRTRIKVSLEVSFAAGEAERVRRAHG